MHRHDRDESSEALPHNPHFSEEEEMQAGKSTRWFGYIAVGITVVSMLLGLALMIGAAYLFFRARQ